MDITVTGFAMDSLHRPQAAGGIGGRAVAWTDESEYSI
jgi:hypothetical protein